MPDENNLTPEQIEAINNYGSALLASPDMTNIRHPLQAFASMFNALSGRQHVNLAEKYRAGQRRELTERTVVPRSGAPITGSTTPTEPSTTPTPTGNNVPNVGEGELSNPEGRRLRTITAGRSGAQFTVADEHADRFQKFLDALEGTGYTIIPDQSSGYAYRNIANTNRRSLHADGNAIDINSRLNARGRRGNFDEATMRRLMAEHGFRWGRDFPFRDDMHIEIDPNFKPPAPVATGNASGTPLPTGNSMPTIGAPARNALDAEPVTGNLTGRSNLGAGSLVAGNAQAQAAETGNSNITPVQDSPNAGSVSRNRPVGAPPRIPRDLNIERIERTLQMGAALSPQQIQDLTKQYQELIQPKGVETPGGISYYDPFSGEFMYFAPKLQTAPESVGDISVQRQYMISPQGRQDIPRAPMIGASGAPPPQSNVTPPAAGGGVPMTGASGATPQSNVTPPANTPPSQNLPPYIQDILRAPSPSTEMNLPPFPETGNINDLANFSTQYNSQRGAVGATVQDATKQINQVRERANTAGRALESLNTIKAATLSAPNLIRGQGISDFVQKYAVYFRNLGINIPSGTAEGEIISKLNAQLASLAVQDITARGTNFQLDTLMRNFPSLGQSLEGSLALLDYLQQEQRQHQELGRIANELRPDQAVRWNQIETAYHNNNPIYLNIPGTRGRPGTRVYTGRIVDIPDALEKVKDGESFITPDGRLGTMSAELRRKYQGAQP